MKLLFLLTLIGLTPAYAYRFLCNSITAEGTTESDSCSQSCVSAPTRWPNKSMSYNVSTSTLPTGVSAQDWTSVIHEAFANWTNTPGVGLTTQFGGEGKRSFGMDINNHDIFFITDDNTWIEAVGAAPDGILGVTLPSYYCPTSQIPYRRIDDADMILNGVPSSGFKWKSTCPALNNDCQSMLGTVSHELGHALGLGHPASESNHLMSAIAVSLVEQPQMDDQEGLRVLYPGGTPGGLGAACQCSSGLTCHAQSSNHYCSKTCMSNNDCSLNSSMICSVKTLYCEFPATVAALHEECTGKLCDTQANLRCVGVNENQRFCFEDCTQSQVCSNAAETCRQLSTTETGKINAYACIESVKQGAACGQAIVCESGNTCTSGVCVASAPSGSSGSSCSATRAPSEIWLLCLLLAILVSRSKKKC